MVSTLQFQLDLGADRPQLRVERLLGDRQAAEQHRDDPFGAPDQHDQRGLDRRDLEHALVEQGVGGQQLVGGGRDERLQRRPVRAAGRPARRGAGGVAGRLQLVGRVELGLELDRLLRRAGEPEHLEAVAGLAADRRGAAASGSRVSGLYWNTMTLSDVPLAGSSWTRPPRSSLGEFGKLTPAPGRAVPGLRAIASAGGRRRPGDCGRARPRRSREALQRRPRAVSLGLRTGRAEAPRSPAAGASSCCSVAARCSRSRRVSGAPSSTSWSMCTVMFMPPHFRDPEVGVADRKLELAELGPRHLQDQLAWSPARRRPAARNAALSAMLRIMPPVAASLASRSRSRSATGVRAGNARCQSTRALRRGGERELDDEAQPAQEGLVEGVAHGWWSRIATPR